MTEFFKQPHRKLIAGILGGLLIILLVASCVPSRDVAYMSQPVVTAPAVAAGQPPVIVAPQSSGGSGFFGAFAGSMLGSMVGNSFGGSRSTHTTTVITRTPQTFTTTAPAQRYATPTYRPPVTNTFTSPRGVTSRVTTRPSTFGSGSRTSISVGRRR